MTNTFLAVSKDLFNLKLNPTEILVLAQIMEFQRNTNDCFISNKKLAEQFGVSESTVKRALDKLENLGFIVRDTSPSQKGKERHMKANLKKIEEAAKANLNLAEDNEKSTKANLNLAESSKCSFRKEQNEPIKEKGKDNLLKDNIGEIEKPSALSISLSNNPEEKKPVEEKKLPEYLKVSKEKLDAMGARYELVVGNLGYIIDTGVRIELI